MGKGRECENKKNLSYKNTKRQRFFKPKAPHSNEIHDILLEWRRGTAKLWFQLNIPPLPLPRSHFLSQYCFTHDFRILRFEHKPERWFFVETHPAPTCIPVMLLRHSAFLQKPHLLGSSPPPSLLILETAAAALQGWKGTEAEVQQIVQTDRGKKSNLNFWTCKIRVFLLVLLKI